MGGQRIPRARRASHPTHANGSDDDYEAWGGGSDPVEGGGAVGVPAAVRAVGPCRAAPVGSPHLPGAGPCLTDPEGSGLWDNSKPARRMLILRDEAALTDQNAVGGEAEKDN